MSTIQEKIAEFTKKREELNREISELGSQLLKEETAKLFEKYPDLEEISWTQYTPYFNDGDTCEFSAHAEEPSITIAGETEEWVYVYKTPENRFQEVALDFKNIIRYVDEDVLLDMFGDHVKVTIIRDGIETDRYDHD